MKSFRFVLLKMNKLEKVMKEDSFEYITNPRVSVGEGDVILLDLWKKEVTAEKEGRNVLSNTFELNENYMEYSLETLVTIP